MSEAGRNVITKTAVTTKSMAAVFRFALLYRSCSVSLAFATTDRRGSLVFGPPSMFPVLDVFLASMSVGTFSSLITSHFSSVREFVGRIRYGLSCHDRGP